MGLPWCGIKNPPSKAGDVGSIPGLGTKIPYAVKQLRPCAAAAARETHMLQKKKPVHRNYRNSTCRNEDPVQPKKKKKSCICHSIAVWSWASLWTTVFPLGIMMLSWKGCGEESRISSLSNPSVPSARPCVLMDEMHSIILITQWPNYGRKPILQIRKWGPRVQEQAHLRSLSQWGSEVEFELLLSDFTALRNTCKVPGQWGHTRDAGKGQPGFVFSLATQRVKNLPAVQETRGNIPWRREWQPTPVFLPGEFHGQRSLVGYGPWGGKESAWLSD